MDLTVAAIPFYFGTMAAEQRWLKRRAAQQGPSAADYTRPDTVASLSMGVGSLVVPLVTHRLARHLALGEGRHARTLVRLGVAAVAATTIADRLARLDEPAADPVAGAGVDAAPAGAGAGVEAAPTGAASIVSGPSERRRRIAGMARRVASVGGVVALATGTVAAGSTYLTRTSPNRVWRRRRSRRDLGTGLAAWLVAVFGWDFIYYWNHRFQHESRGLWAIHVVHHSSEHYNLSTALRQPVADALGVFLPYSLLCHLGVRPALIEQARGVNLIYQYWIHTDAIRRLGRAESVLNTPSHHRVHHGSNRRYLDRNHGSILILWDRLFGTFEPEDEPVVYGLTRNIDTYNPARIATHEYADIVGDVAGATTWRDRLSFLLRGPGWAYARRAERAPAVEPERRAA